LQWCYPIGHFGLKVYFTQTILRLDILNLNNFDSNYLNLMFVKEMEVKILDNNKALKRTQGT
jgi:hypothetical protein